MKRAKQVLCGVLVAALMIPLAAAAPGSGSKSLSDIQGHWAQKEIETAIASGWVDGYPDGTFQPEKTITRAEFTKMLLDAIHLTPDSETVAWMKEHAKTKDQWGSAIDYVPKLYDMADHWLTTQGWLDAALYAGMVVPSDYNGRNFRPEKEIARYEIALMTDRALGLVAPANAYAGEELPFADNGDILDWMKGYVSEAVKAGILQGYPDNTFRPNKTSTRAEAVVMVQRMLDEMEQGLDPAIQVVVQYHRLGDEETFTVHCDNDDIQLQVIDNVVYASLIDLYEVRAEIMREVNDPYDVYRDPDKLDTQWKPEEQVVDIVNWLGIVEEKEHFQMGSTAYQTYGSNGREFIVPARALYGQIMLPVCDLNHPGQPAQDLSQSGWDAATNTLTIPLVYSDPPLNLS